MSHMDRAARVVQPFTMPSLRPNKVVMGEVSDPVLAAVLAPGSVFGEQFRILRSKVDTLARDRPLRCLGLVSASAGEGTTTAALGFARAMAEEKERRVLLVEAGLRASKIEGLLGLAQEDGLADWLRQPSGRVHLRQVDPWGFTLLSSGQAEGHSPELLESPDLVRLLETAIRTFDFVVVDCPPLIPAADSVVLQDLLDGLLLVVRARGCQRETLLRALSHVKSDLILGMIFTEDRHILSRSASYFHTSLKK
jgi:succinoglycan biosynthesis transport protein ExoP